MTTWLYSGNIAQNQNESLKCYTKTSKSVITLLFCKFRKLNTFLNCDPEVHLSFWMHLYQERDRRTQLQLSTLCISAYHQSHFQTSSQRPLTGVEHGKIPPSAWACVTSLRSGFRWRHANGVRLCGFAAFYWRAFYSRPTSSACKRNIGWDQLSPTN